MTEHQIFSKAELCLEGSKNTFSHSLHLIEVKRVEGDIALLIAGPESTVQGMCNKAILDSVSVFILFNYF